MLLRSPLLQLHLAASAGQVEALRAVLNHPMARPKRPDPRDLAGRTPLHDACWWQKKVAAEVLIRNGAKVAAKDRNGCTPLERATQAGRRGLLEYLHRCQILPLDFNLNFENFHTYNETAAAFARAARDATACGVDNALALEEALQKVESQPRQRQSWAATMHQQDSTAARRRRRRLRSTAGAASSHDNSSGTSKSPGENSPDAAVSERSNDEDDDSDDSDEGPSYLDGSEGDPHRFDAYERVQKGLSYPPLRPGEETFGDTVEGLVGTPSVVGFTADLSGRRNGGFSSGRSTDRQQTIDIFSPTMMSSNVGPNSSSSANRAVTSEVVEVRGPKRLDESRAAVFRRQLFADARAACGAALEAEAVAAANAAAHPTAKRFSGGGGGDTKEVNSGDVGAGEIKGLGGSDPGMRQPLRRPTASAASIADDAADETSTTTAFLPPAIPSSVSSATLQQQQQGGEAMPVWLANHRLHGVTVGSRSLALDEYLGLESPEFPRRRKFRRRLRRVRKMARDRAKALGQDLYSQLREELEDEESEQREEELQRLDEDEQPFVNPFASEQIEEEIDELASSDEEDEDNDGYEETLAKIEKGLAEDSDNDSEAVEEEDDEWAAEEAAQEAYLESISTAEMDASSTAADETSSTSSPSPAKAHSSPAARARPLSSSSSSSSSTTAVTAAATTMGIFFGEKDKNTEHMAKGRARSPGFVHRVPSPCHPTTTPPNATRHSLQPPPDDMTGEKVSLRESGDLLIVIYRTFHANFILPTSNSG